MDDHRRRPDSGFIVMAVVLVLSLMALSSPALIYLGAQAILLSRTRYDGIRAGLAARSATQVAIASWRTSELATLPLGGERGVVDAELSPGVRMRASLERLGPTLYLVRGEGHVGVQGAPAARARVGHLVTALNLEEGLDSLESGSAVGVDPFQLPGWPSPAILSVIADQHASGSLAPAPRATSAVCDRSASGNWGAPGEPGHPCAAFFPLIYVRGSLTVVDGAGQGVLVVEGDLALGPDVRFDGVVLVEGTLWLSEGARITGVVRVRLGPAPSSGEIVFDPATLRAAVAASPALNRPFRPGRRVWIPLF